MWAQIINVILGVWLLVSPAILASDRTVANNDHIVGPLIAAFAVISWWEVTRDVRLYNLLPAAWLLLAPWVLGYNDTSAILNDMAVGLLVIILCSVKGKVEGRFGGGWSAIWKKDPVHAQEAAKQPRV